MTQPENRNAGFVVFDNPKAMLTTQQVADALGVSPDTVRKWIYTETLRAHRIKGGVLRIRASDAEALLSPAVNRCSKDAKLLKEKSNGI